MLRHMAPSPNAYGRPARMSTRPGAFLSPPARTLLYLVARMKRKPKLTKRERKALAPERPKPEQHQHQHIHCITCGKHLDPADFEQPATATIITCAHGSNVPACVACMPRALAAVKEHDRTNQPVKMAQAWH